MRSIRRVGCFEEIDDVVLAGGLRDRLEQDHVVPVEALPIGVVLDVELLEMPAF